MNTTKNQSEISFISLGEDGLFAQFKFKGQAAYYDKRSVLHLLSGSDVDPADRDTLQNVLTSFNSINAAFDASN